MRGELKLAVYDRAERKRLMGVARMISRRMYEGLKSVGDDDFFKAAHHVINVFFQHKFSYLEHYIENMEKRGADIFNLHAELMKLPYLIKLVRVSYSGDDVKRVLRQFDAVESEIKGILERDAEKIFGKKKNGKNDGGK